MKHPHRVLSPEEKKDIPPGGALFVSVRTLYFSKRLTIGKHLTSPAPLSSSFSNVLKHVCFFWHFAVWEPVPSLCIAAQHNATLYFSTRRPVNTREVCTFKPPHKPAALSPVTPGLGRLELQGECSPEHLDWHQSTQSQGSPLTFKNSSASQATDSWGAVETCERPAHFLLRQ